MRFAGLIGGIAGMVIGAGAAAQPVKEGVVLELFTSQGCSSCPSADEIFHQIGEANADVIPLAFHVDYWDYLGWKDTFGSPLFSARQFAYSNIRGEKQVFTPQVMINGEFSFSGNNRPAIEAGLEAAKGRYSTVETEVTEGDAYFEVEMRADMEVDHDVWLAYTQDHAEVDIKRGENAGVKMVYSNIVRELSKVDEWKGRMPKRVLVPKREGLGTVVFLQAPRAGHIHYGAKLN